jgi:hypothetical protein
VRLEILKFLKQEEKGKGFLNNTAYTLFIDYMLGTLTAEALYT